MPTPFRIAYNINCEHPHLGANRQAAKDHQVELHSAFTLLYDDYKTGFEFTRDIQARSPETQVIHRRYMPKDANGGWDGNLWEAPDGNSPTGFLSPTNWINFLQNLNAPNKVIHQVLCEPSVSGGRLTTKNHWLSECIKEASRRGMRLCVDNVQPVVLVQADLDAGLYDELLFTLAAHPEHFLGIHEYALGDLWFNCNAADMLDLAFAASLNVPPIVERSDTLSKSIYVAHPSEAHLGRLEILAQRCRKIGATIPRMIYTEIGWDRTRIAQQNTVDSINGRVAMGYPTLTQYWKTRYPQWTKARTAFEQVKWLNRAMPDYVVGACLFGKDTSFENGAYHIDDSEFQGYLRDYSSEVRYGTKEPPTNPPPSEPLTLETLAARVSALEAWQKTKTGDGK